MGDRGGSQCNADDRVLGLIITATLGALPPASGDFTTQGYADGSWKPL